MGWQSLKSYLDNPVTGCRWALHALVPCILRVIRNRSRGSPWSPTKTIADTASNDVPSFNFNSNNKLRYIDNVSTRDKHRYSRGLNQMARGRRTASRMEKSVQNGTVNLSGAAPTTIVQVQLDGGEVEAQVKRIMFSAASITGLSGAFKLGLFQFAPSIGDFNQDEAVVISGVIGNHFQHNETITMRVPKDWYVAVLFEQLDPAAVVALTYNLQLNYKVLN